MFFIPYSVLLFDIFSSQSFNFVFFPFGISCVYSFLWVRQRVFYSSPTLGRLRSKYLRWLSFAVLPVFFSLMISGNLFHHSATSMSPFPRYSFHFQYRHDCNNCNLHLRKLCCWLHRNIWEQISEYSSLCWNADHANYSIDSVCLSAKRTCHWRRCTVSEF